MNLKISPAGSVESMSSFASPDFQIVNDLVYCMSLTVVFMAVWEVSHSFLIQKMLWLELVYEIGPNAVVV